MSFGAVLSGLALLALGSLRAQGAWGVVYAPAGAEVQRPPIVFLHGMWTGPESACASFSRAATRFGFLVCPRGNAPNGHGGPMWVGTYADAARPIRVALQAAKALAPGRLDGAKRGTLMGYSNGAYFAAEVACTERGRWSGLVLLSMKLDLDTARLRAAGVERVLLAAGDRDGARDSMAAAAARLDAAGMTARFMTLGPGGHDLPSDIDARIEEALAWAQP